MDYPDHDPKLTPGHVLDGVAAGLWPSLSPAERRERAFLALGLQPLATWVDGRMVYLAEKAL